MTTAAERMLAAYQARSAGMAGVVDEEEEENAEPATAAERMLAAYQDRTVQADPLAEEARRAAARERLEAQRAAGEAQWERINEPGTGKRFPGHMYPDHPAHQIRDDIVQGAVDTGRALAGGVEDVAASAQGALAAPAQGLANMELPPRREGLVGRPMGVNAPPLNEETTPILPEPVREELERFAAFAGRNRANVDAARTAPPEGITGDFWADVSKDPVRAVSLHALRQVPQLVAMFGAGAAAGKAGAMSVGYAAESGAAWNEAKDDGASDEEAFVASGLVGVANMALESLPVTKALARMRKTPTRSALTEWSRAVLEQSMTGGGTETLQEFNNILASTLTYAEDHEWGVEDLKRVGAAGVLGFVLEGGVGAVTAPRGGTTTPPATEPQPGGQTREVQEQEATVEEEGRQATEGQEEGQAQQDAEVLTPAERPGRGLSPEAVASWVDRLGTGKSHLSTQEVDGAEAIVYRDAKGRAVSAAVLNADGTTADLLFTDKSRGALASRAAVAVGRQLEKRGVTTAKGEISPEAVRFRDSMAQRAAPSGPVATDGAVIDAPAPEGPQWTDVSSEYVIDQKGRFIDGEPPPGSVRLRLSVDDGPSVTGSPNPRQQQVIESIVGSVGRDYEGIRLARSILDEEASYPPQPRAPSPPAAPIEVTRYDPSPVSINSRKWYHGAKGPVGKVDISRSSLSTVRSEQGPGLYLTSAPENAALYAEGGEIYESRVSVEKTLDLDAPLDADLLTAWRSVIERHYPRVAPRFEKQVKGLLRKRPSQRSVGWNNADFWRQLVGLPARTSSAEIHQGLAEKRNSLGLSRVEALGMMLRVHAELVRKGYDALTLQEEPGRADSRQVLILLDPDGVIAGRRGLQLWNPWGRVWRGKIERRADDEIPSSATTGGEVADAPGVPAEGASDALNAPESPTVIERLPAARPEEAGFIAKPAELVADIKRTVDRWIKPQGNLPVSAWKLKLNRDHRLGAHQKGLEYRLRELNQAIKRYKGPLTPKQLTRYLGDALRGTVALQVGAETARFDETQIRRIAKKRGIDESVVAAEFERVANRAPEGLAAAPDFLGIIGEMRADIDATSRAFRREGYPELSTSSKKKRLLDDGAARNLERSSGLYVHRSYEAFRGKSKQYLRRVEKTPLWNRAKELISKEHPDLTEKEVDGLLRKFIERGERPVLPGNVPEGALNRSTLFQRTGVRDLERLLLGERRDVRSLAVDTVIGQVTLLENYRFLKALREDGLGTYLLERPAGRHYKPIDESIEPLATLAERLEGGEEARLVFRKAARRRYGPMTASGVPGGKALHTTPEILRELEEAMPHASEWPLWLKIWSFGNFAVKTNLTVLSPTTTGRNYFSNVLAALANGYNPFGAGAGEAAATVFNDIRGSSDRDLRLLYQRYVELGLMDQNADLGDLRRLGAFADLMRLETDPGARPVTWVKTFLRKAGQLYQHGDNFWKILGFHQERARLEAAHPKWAAGQLDTEAAEIVGRVLQNYSQLPRAARAISANPVVAPFFSFTWAMFRNTKETFRQAVTEVRSDNSATRKSGYRRLVGLMVALSLPEMLTFALRWMSNTDDEDDDALREFVYPWDRGSTLGIVSHKPGEYVYFNWGFMDYFSRLKEPLRFGLEAVDDGRPTDEIVDDAFADFGEEILLSSMIDAARGETADGQRVWLEKEDPDEKRRKAMEHIWRTGRPGVLRNVENINDARTGQRGRKMWVELVALFGPRFTTVDVHDRLDRYGRRFSTQLGEATRVYSQYANRSADPGKSDIVGGYVAANRERLELLAELRRKLDAAVVSGLTVREANRAVVDAGASAKYVRMAWGGRFEPVQYRRGNHWRTYETELQQVAREAVAAWDDQARPSGTP